MDCEPIRDSDQYGEVNIVDTSENVKAALTYDTGYTEGKRDGYAEGFHDCLVCMIKSSTEIMQRLLDKEREYNFLVERNRRGKSQCVE